MKILSVFVFCQILYFVYGWGPIGHSIVVRIAQSRVAKETEESLLSLLPFEFFGNLSLMASWADNIIYPDTNPRDYQTWQWTRPLHYINTPDWACDFDAKRDCVDNICVSGAIGNYSEQLKTLLDDQRQREALYFLIHFVGDIHQPMHTGFSGDRGGNSVRGHFLNSGSLTNLHSMWDTGLMDHRIATNFSWNITAYYQHIESLVSTLTETEMKNLVVTDWIHENINYVCNGIYTDENNATMNASTHFNLTDVYYQKHIGTVEKRMALGGVRLGQILDELAKSRPKPPKEGLSNLTIVLITLVCVEAVLCIIFASVLCLRCKN